MNKDIVKMAEKVAKYSGVVIILPYAGDKVLLQLRDQDHNIPFPGHWGFFGGSIDDGEQPRESALRELDEELGFHPDELHLLDVTIIAELNNLMSHVFFCRLTTSVERLTLTEGMDFGLFTVDEVMTKKLSSERMKGLFPVVPLAYIEKTIYKLWDRVYHNRKNV